MRIPWILKNAYLFKTWTDIYRGKLDLRLRNGLLMRLNSKHDIPILWEVMGEKCYGNLHDLPEKPTIIDIGANIGSFSLWALRQRPHALVFAYEPMSKNFELLSANVRVNGFQDSISLHKKGVAGESGTRFLHISVGGDSGHHTLHPSSKRENFTSKPEEITCVTLDDVLESKISVDMLKIDVEGAEVEIVASSSQLHKVNNIIIEGKMELLRPILEKAGFSVSSNKHRLIVGKRRK